MSDQYNQEQLVRAEAAHNTATDAVEKAKFQVTSIDTRLGEKAIARAAVIGEAQAGAIDEQTAVLRLAVIDADIKDLNVMMTEAQGALTLANVHAETTANQLRVAREIVARDEKAFAQQALDATIRDLETKLCRAPAERFRVAGPSASSLFNLWVPTRELRDAAYSHIVPKLS